MVTTVLFQEELKPGLPVGDYILYERIGIGGEGLIFSAWDKVNDRVVAIKFFPKRDEQGAPTNLSSELAVFSRLFHPNIREIFSIGETNEFLYSVMHYFPLGSLSERIFTKTLTIDDALFISVQLASALDFLQKNNIVHRDLKPTNILLDIENHAYLTDFGLAKPISDTTQALHTGHGTPIYAAPEQHTLSKINYKSDIYSFGIMLYEMLTGALPWGGSVSLAIMQLDNREQLPDPHDANPALPPGLVYALRKMTKLNPDFRPATAGEAIESVLQAFDDSGYQLPPELRAPPVFSPKTEISFKEANHLIAVKQAGWDPKREKIKINYSHYAFLHSVFSKNGNTQGLDTQALKFMLQGSLTYGVEINYWWDQLDSDQEKIKVCQQVIATDSERAVKRTITQLLEVYSFDELEQIDSALILSRLITLAYESHSLSFKQAIFKMLFAVTKPAQRWHKVSFSEAAELILGNLALYDSAVSREAARFIGHIKSGIAVDMLVNGTETESAPNMQALTEVWERAGSIPRGISPTVKLQLGIELGWKQFTRQRQKLVRAYLAAALASALGIGLHVFISMRVPTIINVTRILNMFGNGLLFGPLIGLGIFLAIWIPLRLKVLTKTARVITGTVIGGFLTSLAFMLFHILYLNAFPDGPLVTLGALVLAFGFSLTNLTPSPIWVRMVGSAATTAAAVAGTWGLYVSSSVTPMLYYNQDQPLQTSLLIAMIAVILGGIPYVFNLRDKQEEGIDHE
jgi:serine/threonine protein kinase